MYLDFVGLPGCGSPRSFPPAVAVSAADKPWG